LPIQLDPEILANRVKALRKLSIQHILSSSIMSDINLIEKQKDLVTQKSMLSTLANWLDD